MITYCLVYTRPAVGLPTSQGGALACGRLTLGARAKRGAYRWLTKEPSAGYVMLGDRSTIVLRLQIIMEIDVERFFFRASRRPINIDSKQPQPIPFGICTHETRVVYKPIG